MEVKNLLRIAGAGLLERKMHVVPVNTLLRTMYMMV